MLNNGLVVAFLFLLAIPAFGREKKSNAEVIDRQALATIHIYCIDKANLSDTDRFLVDGFLKAESKPKHLITKIPWTRVDDCETANPDATVKVELIPMDEAITQGGVSGPGQPSMPVGRRTDSHDPEAPIRGVLSVKDSDGKLIYRAGAMPLTSDDPQSLTNQGGPVSRQDTLYHLFWALRDDVASVQSPAAK